jgi:integrase
MSLYKRGDTWWFNFKHTHNGVFTHYQESAKTGDRNLALKRERTFRTRIENGEFGIKELAAKDSNVTLKQLFDGLESDYRIRGILTARNKSNFKMVREAFKDSTRALSVTSAQIDHFIERRKKDKNAPKERRQKGKYAPSTINRMTGMLALAYKLAVRRAEIDPKDVPHIRHLSEKGNARAGFFEEAQFRALHAALPPDLADFALFAYLSSWRKNEIATLKWSDVEKDVIHLREENAKDRCPRTLPIAGAELIDLIKRRREARLVDGSTFSGYVFHREGQPVREFRKAWASACVKANLKGRLFHDLRRSAVVNLIDAGVPVVTAMSISGHSTFAMFKRYGIRTDANQTGAMEAVQRYSEAQRAKVVAISK